jgi:primosomal protein N' (replication factor Y)
MGYAEVSVNSPIARRQSFSYAIPPGLAVGIGQAVLAPFGAKVLQGIVVALTELPAVEETREIAGIIDAKPLLTTAQIAWARWLSEYYLTPLWDAIALMLPPGFERRVLAFFSLAQNRIHLGSLPTN